METEQDIGCVMNKADFDVAFNAGWNAAIAEVKEKVEGYIEAKQEGQPAGTWEEWLPPLLELLAEQ